MPGLEPSVQHMRSHWTDLQGQSIAILSYGITCLQHSRDNSQSRMVFARLCTMHGTQVGMLLHQTSLSLNVTRLHNCDFAVFTALLPRMLLGERDVWTRRCLIKDALRPLVLLLHLHDLLPSVPKQSPIHGLHNLLPPAVRPLDQFTTSTYPQSALPVPPQRSDCFPRTQINQSPHASSYSNR